MESKNGIPEGRFKIVCRDGRAHSAEIITPSGDIIFASHISIEMNPGKLCTATITVNEIPIDIEVNESKVSLAE